MATVNDDGTLPTLHDDGTSVETQLYDIPNTGDLAQKLDASVNDDERSGAEEDDGPELSRFGREDGGGVGDLFATHSSSLLNDSRMETNEETSMGTPPFDSNVVTPIPKSTKSSDQMMEVGRLLKLCGENLKSNASQIAALEVNQEMHHVALLEARNEIQRAKIYARNRGREFIRDSMDIDYEKSNLVIYNIPISSWNRFLKHYGNEQVAIRKFAMKFIHEYWPGYLEIDVKPSKIKQDEKEKKHSPNMWRMLLKMASPSDATKLKNRCIAMGFYNVRPGMTKLMRDYCLEIHEYVEKENKKKAPDSETVLVRKFQHKVAEVKRADGKFVRWLPYHAPSAPFYNSKMSEKVSLVKPEISPGESSSNGSTPPPEKAQKTQKNNQAKLQGHHSKNGWANHKSTHARSKSPTLDLGSSSNSRGGSTATVPEDGLKSPSVKSLTDKILDPSLTSGSSKKRPASNQLVAPSTKYQKILETSGESEGDRGGRNKNRKKKEKKKQAFSPRIQLHSQDSKVPTPKKLSATEISKLKVAQLKPLHAQTQLKLSELQEDNKRWSEYAAKMEESLRDLREQLQLQKSLANGDASSNSS